MLAACLALLLCQDGNRLTYLDESDPYYVSRSFPKLTTPQWVGEEGVEAVIVLAIDDMRGHEKWEAYLRPILERLKKIDGRAPVSIMTCKIDPKHEHLQKWLQEGLSLEVHTIDHPCPLLKDGDFAKAKSTYDRCVDQMAEIPFSKPVAFRMPCCDSLNTPSPRFYAEIFNKTTEKGHFLTIDTSVFNVPTPKDKDLPREMVVDEDGKEKFRKYIPFPSFVNTIEDYPYPYVIGGLCWEFPCAIPSDWEAQNIHKPAKKGDPASPITMRDMKTAIDITVAKKGVFNFVFHPYDWILNTQVVELIDHVVEKHGRKVKFLNFREAQERLDKNLLGGHPLRATNGADNGVRLLDLDNDGFLDVVIGTERTRLTRLWSPKSKSWKTSDFPAAMVMGEKPGFRDAGARFGVVDKGGRATLLQLTPVARGAWSFRQEVWVEEKALIQGLDLVDTSYGMLDRGLRLRDLDGDGTCEVIAGSRGISTYRWNGSSWVKLPFWLTGTAIVSSSGVDWGLRFIDLNGDGRSDIVLSNEERWSVSLFKDMNLGWEEVSFGKPGDPGAIPMIVRDGTNNGAWFHSGHLWVQNEDTAKMPNLVDRRTFDELLQKK